MEKMTNKISYTLAIIIPNWNGGVKLECMLKSILRNTYEDFNVFVVDDQSTDNSLDVLRRFSLQDDRIHYTIRDRAPKGGQTCRNIGATLAQSAKYMIFFDNDDIVAPYCFTQRVTYMDEHPNLDMAVFPAMNFNETPCDLGLAARSWGSCYLDDSLRAFFRRTLPMVGWTNIYRTSSYQRLCLSWDEKIKVFQDTDFNVQSIIKGIRFDYAIDKEEGKIMADYYYRSNVNSKSVSQKLSCADSFDSNIYLVHKVIDGMSSSSKEKYKDDLLSYVLYFAQFMISNGASVRKLIDNTWIKSNKKIYCLLYVWSFIPFLRGKGKYYEFCFHKLLKKDQTFTSKWMDYNRYLTSKLLNIR